MDDGHLRVGLTLQAEADRIQGQIRVELEEKFEDPRSRRRFKDTSQEMSEIPGNSNLCRSCLERHFIQTQLPKGVESKETTWRCHGIGRPIPLMLSAKRAIFEACFMEFT